MSKTKIEWTSTSNPGGSVTPGATWNPIKSRLISNIEINTAKGLKIIPAGKVGYHCEHISPGCVNCYAEAMNRRCLPAWGTGLKYNIPNRERVEIFLDEKVLLQPLRWKEPRKIFPCSMTDLFAEFVPDEFIDGMFAVMALCPQHTFQLLTKRADRMLSYFSPGSFRDARIATRAKTLSASVTPFRLPSELVFDARRVARNDPWEMVQWPLGNVHLGVSVENQQYADERIPLLLQTPAAVRWISYEPALGPLTFRWRHWVRRPAPGGSTNHLDGLRGLDWVVVGGESGHAARTFDIEWARTVIDECKEAGVACFVKQLGANPIHVPLYPNGEHKGEKVFYDLKDRKGGEMSEWPEDLRVREFPEVTA